MKRIKLLSLGLILCLLLACASDGTSRVFGEAKVIHQTSETMTVDAEGNEVHTGVVQRRVEGYKGTTELYKLFGDVAGMFLSVASILFQALR